jgi:hypothetical protein
MYYMYVIYYVLYFNAMNSVHFCSFTLRSNQMHYFYYLEPNRRPTKQEIMFKDTLKMARGWRRNISGKILKN